MTNQERRNALNTARKHALRHACAAEEHDPEIDPMIFTRHTRLAEMWAAVAEAMKDGDPVHDGPDGAPMITNTYTTLTR